MTEMTTQGGVSRRSIAKGAAWTLPAVVVAAPAAEAALSPTTVVVSLNGTFCKDPGGGTCKTYIVELTIENLSTISVVVDIISLTVNGVTLTDGASGVTITPGTTTVPGRTKRVVTIGGECYADSANGQATVNYTVNGVAGSKSTLAANDIPPNNNTSAGCPATIVGHPYLVDTAL